MRRVRTNLAEVFNEAAGTPEEKRRRKGKENDAGNVAEEGKEPREFSPEPAVRVTQSFLERALARVRGLQ